MAYKRTPIFYMGGKYRLLKQLIPLFPKECETFVDAFGGGGVVSMNYQGKSRTIYNEINPVVVGLVNMVKYSNLKELNGYYLNKIQQYDLRTKSARLVSELKSEGYYKLRNLYNESAKKRI